MYDEDLTKINKISETWYKRRFFGFNHKYQILCKSRNKRRFWEFYHNEQNILKWKLYAVFGKLINRGFTHIKISENNINAVFGNLSKMVEIAENEE